LPVSTFQIPIVLSQKTPHTNHLPLGCLASAIVGIGDTGIRRHVLLAEMKRIQVGVLEYKTKSDGSSGQLGEFMATLPDNDSLDFIAENFRTIFESEAVERFVVGRLNLNLNAACGGRG